MPDALSLTSTTIGFVTFFVTLLTWFNVFWNAFSQALGAPRHVIDYLSTLRQALFEERNHLKRLKKRNVTSPSGSSKEMDACHNIYYDSGPIKIISDAVRDLIKDFKSLEKPFLIPPHPGHEKDLEWSYDANQRYYTCSLFQRLRWIQTSKGVQDVQRRLNNLQMRRIAVETTENQGMLAELLEIIKKKEWEGGMQKCDGVLGEIKDMMKKTEYRIVEIVDEVEECIVY